MSFVIMLLFTINDDEPTYVRFFPQFSTPQQTPPDLHLGSRLLSLGASTSVLAAMTPPPDKMA
jgi:hypothetical protein